VRAAGDIGAFVIVSEQAVAAGVRRIEALTGPGAIEEIQRQRRILREASQALKSAPKDVPERIAQLQKSVKEAKKKQASGAAADVGSALDKLKDELTERGGVSSAVVDLPELDLAALRELAGRAKSLSKDLALGLFGREGERVPFLVISQGAAQQRGVKAGDVAREIAALLGGGGGGKPDLAQGQGTNADALGAALDRVAGLFGERLGESARS
jgi:alanyl-tRNA synthetase